MKKRRLKKWPSDGSPLSAEEIVVPVMSAFKRAHAVSPPIRGAAPYDGLELGRDSAATCSYPDDKGAGDPIERWFLLVFQLGVEQGRRLVESDPTTVAALLDKDRLALALAETRTAKKGVAR